MRSSDGPVILLGAFFVLCGSCLSPADGTNADAKRSDDADRPLESRRGTRSNGNEENVEDMDDDSSSRCVAPGNEAGSCQHLSRCFVREYNSSMALARQRECRIDDAYVGVCCSRRSQVRRGGSRSTRYLAAAADDDDDDDDPRLSLPIVAAVVDRKGEAARTDAGKTIGDVGDPRGKSRGCGTTTKSGTRLVGGQVADPGEWPWMAALLRRDARQYCGGVLVTDRHVLTAAHCVYRYRPRDIAVRLGEYDFAIQDESRAMDFAVTEIRVHEDFDYSSYENDVAIVKIHRPTIFDAFVWPICLPPVGQTFENKSAVVIGWGTRYYGGPASSVLMEVGVPIWPQERCVGIFAQRIPKTAMCAGAYDGGRDACQGDSGGPLLHQLGNGRWVNVGIVSWGIRCGEPGHPGIYTRVSAYLDWIFANAVF